MISHQVKHEIATNMKMSDQINVRDLISSRGQNVSTGVYYLIIHQLVFQPMFVHGLKQQSSSDSKDSTSAGQLSDPHCKPS